MFPSSRSCREIKDLDPTPSGIKVSKMRVPLGVVGIIYESRPNALLMPQHFALNQEMLVSKGGSEAILSNKMIWNCLQEGLKKAGYPRNLFSS